MCKCVDSKVGFGLGLAGPLFSTDLHVMHLRVNGKKMVTFAAVTGSLFVSIFYILCLLLQQMPFIATLASGNEATGTV